MSQNHAHLRVADGHQLPPSTFSTHSDYGSGFEGTNPGSQQPYGSDGGFGGSSMGGQQRVALPSNVKYPPSMLAHHHQRQPPQQMAMTNSHVPTYAPPQPRQFAVQPPSSSVGPGVTQATPHVPMSSEFGAAVVTDVIHQLDVAADENNRLRVRLQENNRILEEKVQTIQRCLESRDRDKQELQERIVDLEGRLREAEAEKVQRQTLPDSLVENSVDETTNKLFEAQVAVMGFKCRVMQLKGELDDLRKEGRADGGARAQIDSLTAENQALREDLASARKAREEGGRQLPQQVTSRSERELMKKLSDMREQNMSQDLVIKEVNQQLSDKRSLFASESQRMHQQTQQMQAEIQRLHADLHRAQNQLAGHQQSSEQRLTSLTTQLNLARQEQARTQELAKQLSVAHAEISRLNTDLSQARKEAEKQKKKSEILETRVKDSTTKMISMEEEKEKQKAAAAPVPKPRGDLSQLKSERERLETELATARSNYEREKRAREGAETELQEERRKSQVLILKNSQLVGQLGTGGAPRPAGFEEERKRLERSVSESEGKVREREGELKQVQMEVERLKREKSQSDISLTVLEKERKEAIDAKIESASKLASVTEEMTTLKSSSTKTKSTPVAVRLNEYAGKLATLEGRYTEEKTAKAKVQSLLEKEKQHTEELERKTLELEREKGHLEGETLRSLQQQKSEVDHRLHEKETEMVSINVRHQEAMDRLRAEMSTQKQNYERKIQEKETALRSKERDLETAQQSVQSRQLETDGEVQRLRQDLQTTRAELQQKESEIARIHSDIQSQAAQLHLMQTDKENLRANEVQVHTRLRESLRDKERLTQELSNTQRVVGEFKKECESLVVDYQGAAKKIELLEEERDRYRNQANMGMRELAQRGERVKALEGERKSLQEQLQHMDLQLKQYMADFRSEREMRESAFQVKEMAERKQQELSSEVSTLQRQLTELQTVKHMDSDVGNIDDPSSVAGVGIMGGREGGGRPHKWSSGSSGRPAPAAPRQSNERPMYSHPVDPSGLNVAPPALPPKPGEYPMRPHNPSMPQQYIGPGGGGGVPGGQGYSPHHHQELVTPGPQVRQFQQPPVSQPPGTVPGMAPSHVPMAHRPMSGGVQYNPMAPHSRAETMPMEPQSRFQMDPHAPHGRAGGQVGGVQPGGMRPVSPVPAELGPPRPLRGSEGGGAWVAPGDRVNPNRPEEACPLCGRNDFATVTDLEIHCAQCTGS